MVATSIKTKTIKMLANFEKNIFIPLQGAQESVDGLHAKLKDIGAALGKHSINLLMEGKEAAIRGFSIVDVNRTEVEPAMAAKKSADPGAAAGVAEEVVGRARSGGYKPAGAIVAVRPNSQIAKGMEALQKGCTLAELQAVLAHPTPEATMAFMMYRPKKRGYGIRKDGDKFFLVFPEGTDKISYK